MTRAPVPGPEADAALLSEPERELMLTLARLQGSTTPQTLARELKTSWQGAGIMIRPLRRMGFVKYRKLPKQTTYELSASGWRVVRVLMGGGGNDDHTS